jgi:hypothetical protein
MTFDPMFPLQSRMQAVSRELADADYTPLPDEEHAADNELHAAGQECARCHQIIEEGADVRRNAKHEWVHETCPEVPPASEAPPA